MVKVITYGSYDMLHYGHIRLLERAKALGDYLIVGVTSDDYDKTRGKINLQQTLMERVEAVRATGIPDEVIVEEYEGQKIDDIRNYGVDIFTVGSDWKGYFDYLSDYCKVVYLDRTEGVSSTEIRSRQIALRMGVVGSAKFIEKMVAESDYVNGIEVVGVCTDDKKALSEGLRKLPMITEEYDSFLDQVDAVYIHSYPAVHYEQVKKAILRGKHVLCESPITLDNAQCEELFALAEENHVILMESIRTAYSTAYQRMLLLLKAGKIGKVISVDATCTNLQSITESADAELNRKWNSLSAWGPTGLLPVFQILGTKYKDKRIISHIEDGYGNARFDLFSKVEFLFDNATASVKVGRGVKSEGELVVSGTKGYVYVPAPWWKTDYFEVRYENPADNKRYFYQLDGEGLRYELVAFSRAIRKNNHLFAIDRDVTAAITGVMHDFETGKDVYTI